METLFSDRVRDVPRSFIREILKDALSPGTISFAGGLPNRALFPAEAIRTATNRVFDIQGKDILQYNPSEGNAELRDWISRRYKGKGLEISPDNILITSGSQQGLDLLGKTLLNDGDGLIIEEPGYLGAIQAFSLYRPHFLPVPVSEDGIDTERLGKTLKSNHPKLMYTVPNFQNPSGITYSKQTRLEVAALLQGTQTVLVEDDPYGDLRFSGAPLPSFYNLVQENTVLLGSFSKIIVPGLRIGWIVAPDALMKKLLIAKQASDLHTDALAQAIILQYLMDNNLDQHIEKIIQAYGKQKDAMLSEIQAHFPEDVHTTHPSGGMFLWLTLPEHIAALDLFKLALKDKVIFVPGDPFYIKQSRVNTLRLNYSCADLEQIATGMQRLSHAIRSLLTQDPK